MQGSALMYVVRWINNEHVFKRKGFVTLPDAEKEYELLAFVTRLADLKQVTLFLVLDVTNRCEAIAAVNMDDQAKLTVMKTERYERLRVDDLDDADLPEVQP